MKRLIPTSNYETLFDHRKYKDLVPLDYDERNLNNGMATTTNYKQNYLGGMISFQNDSDKVVQIHLYSVNPCLDYINLNIEDSDTVKGEYRLEFINPKQIRYFTKLVDNPISFKLTSHGFVKNNSENSNKIYDNYNIFQGQHNTETTMKCFDKEGTSEIIEFEKLRTPKLADYNDLYIPTNDYMYTIPRGVNAVIIKNNLTAFFFNMNGR
jgi:hypothetical protein